MKSIVDQLISVGMTPLQSRIYISLLELGQASASELAKKSQINRVTSYTALNELQEMNLITEDDYDAVRVFRPTGLEHLETVFMTRAKAAIQSYRHIQALIPDLRQLAKIKTPDPSTLYLEGNVAVQQYLDKDLKNATVTALYISHQDHYEVIKHVVKHATESTKRPRVIIPNSIHASLLVYLDHRVVPAKIAHFPTTTILCDDRVAVLLGDESFPQLYVILDSRITDHYRTLFELNWRILSGEHLVVAKNED